MKVTMFDPPSGWRYGYPKRYEPLENETLVETLIRTGYPEKDAEFAAQYCRFWETENVEK